MLKSWKYIIIWAVTLFQIFFSNSLKSQDLDPRAYVMVPTRASILVSGFAFSKGGVLTDPSIPFVNVKASIQTLNIGYTRSFNLLGKTATAFAVFPYSWTKASADLNGQRENINRSGFVDMRLRISVLLLGAPATPIEKFASVKHKPILGSSLTVILPTGQYFSDKLLNLGTNRWSFKPELAYSYPIRKNWLFDVYAGLWLFTPNKQFFTGKSVRTQQPMGAFQAHLSYNINPKMWLAFDATYYTGGKSTVDNFINDDRHDNTRIGATFVFPVMKRSFIKLAASTGAVVRVGENFNTISIGWQTIWIKEKKAL